MVQDNKFQQQVTALAEPCPRHRKPLKKHPVMNSRISDCQVDKVLRIPRDSRHAFSNQVISGTNRDEQGI
jgi:hypothetical protein